MNSNIKDNETWWIVGYFDCYLSRTRGRRICICGKETVICKDSFLRFVNKHTVGECTCDIIQNLIKNKIIQTNLETFGCINPFQNEEIKEKIKNTNIKNLGVPNPAQSDIVMNKIIQTNLERRGCKSPIQDPSVKEKRQKTNLEKYGNVCSVHGDVPKEKTKQTNLERFGTENPFASEIIKDKIVQTNLEKTGYKFPSQNPETALKIARKVNNPSTKIHWKTQEECNCQGGYESAVIDYLNINQIDFLWQSQIFTLSTGRTYRPDLYLPDQDLWVEIKGYMRPDALPKWTEFHNIIQPNSELWDKKKLKEMKIIK